MSTTLQPSLGDKALGSLLSYWHSTRLSVLSPMV